VESTRAQIACDGPRYSASLLLVPRAWVVAYAHRRPLGKPFDSCSAERAVAHPQARLSQFAKRPNCADIPESALPLNAFSKEVSESRENILSELIGTGHAATINAGR
jgi:hypothetical protein